MRSRALPATPPTSSLSFFPPQKQQTAPPEREVIVRSACILSRLSTARLPRTLAFVDAVFDRIEHIVQLQRRFAVLHTELPSAANAPTGTCLNRTVAYADTNALGEFLREPLERVCVQREALQLARAENALRRHPLNSETMIQKWRGVSNAINLERGKMARILSEEPCLA